MKQIGVVAISGDGTVYAGYNYSAGAKVYVSERSAKAAVKNKTRYDVKTHSVVPVSFTFKPAFILEDFPKPTDFELDCL